MKPKCDWCGEEEYHIGILNKEGKEELVCKTCFKNLIKKNTDLSSVPGDETEVPAVTEFYNQNKVSR